MSEDTTKVTQGRSCHAQYLMVDVLQKVPTCDISGVFHVASSSSPAGQQRGGAAGGTERGSAFPSQSAVPNKGYFGNPEKACWPQTKRPEQQHSHQLPSVALQAPCSCLAIFSPATVLLAGEQLQPGALGRLETTTRRAR